MFPPNQQYSMQGLYDRSPNLNSLAWLGQAFYPLKTSFALSFLYHQQYEPFIAPQTFLPGLILFLLYGVFLPSSFLGLIPILSSKLTFVGGLS